MHGTFPEADEGDVWSLSSCHDPDILDGDLSRDHLVAERGNDRRDDREAVLPLVGDQHAQMLSLAVAHSYPASLAFPIPRLLTRQGLEWNRSPEPPAAPSFGYSPWP
jgi:hypothetical protein